MNTEDSKDKTVPMTTGQRLRQAREQLGLSQQAVAERLCLKMSTVRDIEGDNISADLASTFVRGYIRSYAKLVHVPENEVLSVLTEEVPVKVAKVAQMQGFALGKPRKKRDGWLMIFTWLIVFVVVGLTGAWWWQNHKAQQEEIATMANQSSAQLSQHNEGQPIPLSDEHTNNTASAVVPDSGLGSSTDSVAATQQATPQPPEVAVPNLATNPNTVPSAPVTLPTGTADVSTTVANTDGLVMSFSGDCWLQVIDSTGKSLFSGIQKGGTQLNLSGTAPYKLTIGAPAAVQIQFQGNPVDLSRFIKSNRVARLTVPAQ